MENNVALFSLLNVGKTYELGGQAVPVLKSIDFSIFEGEFISIMGPSGSGKSTLLNIIGFLDTPSEGDVVFQGQNINHLTDEELSSLRGKFIGPIFQSFFLIPYLSVYDNIALPFSYQNLDTDYVKDQVLIALQQVGLEHRANHKPHALSGGEMQRVAIARALAIKPKIVIADEPTGSLDSDNTGIIMDLFSSIHRNGTTIVLVTHDPDVASAAGRKITCHDGRLQE